MPRKFLLRAAVFGLIWAGRAYWLAESLEAARLLLAIVIFWVLFESKLAVNSNDLIRRNEEQADVHSALAG